MDNTQNPMKRGPLALGDRKCAFTMDMDLPKLKKASKSGGHTINDILTSVLSQSCYDYF